MKSIFAGLLAAGAFSASLAASVESKVDNGVVTPVQRVVIQPVQNNVIQPTYDIFGKVVVKPLAESAKAVKALAVGEADRLVCVSATDDECGPCRLQHPIIDRLKKDGYDAKIVLTKDYAGPPNVNRTPTLLYYNGDKLVKTNVGLQSYEAITKTLKKPSVEVSSK